MSAHTIDIDKLAEQKVGDCKLLKQIGKGAMGVVYLAEQI